MLVEAVVQDTEVSAPAAGRLPFVNVTNARALCRIPVGQARSQLMIEADDSQIASAGPFAIHEHAALTPVDFIAQNRLSSAVEAISVSVLSVFGGAAATPQLALTNRHGTGAELRVAYPVKGLSRDKFVAAKNQFHQLLGQTVDHDALDRLIVAVYRDGGDV